MPIPRPPAGDEPDDDDGPDLADVVGQERGRFALELAAAGRHHLALIGPPGAGKTMLAQRLPSILPALDDAAALEVTALHSIAGTLPAVPRLIRRPPFQAPHHTATAAALVGGGSGLARPGALSLAHLGVLFLDEAPHFGVSVLNALRQPLEDGSVTLARSQGSTRYPARIQLVLAANPCPCGAAQDANCACSPMARRTYFHRLSGPAARPDRPAGQARPGRRGGAGERAGRAGVVGRRSSSGWWPRARRPPPRWAGRGFSVNAHAPGAAPALPAVPAAERRDPPARRPGRPGHAVGPRVRPGAAGGLDHCGHRRPEHPGRRRRQRSASAAHG